MGYEDEATEQTNNLRSVNKMFVQTQNCPMGADHVTVKAPRTEFIRVNGTKFYLTGLSEEFSDVSVLCQRHCRSTGFLTLLKPHPEFLNLSLAAVQCDGCGTIQVVCFDREITPP